MSYEVLLAVLPTGIKPTAPAPPNASHIAPLLESFLNGSVPTYPLPTGPILQKRTRYEALLRMAFDARRQQDLIAPIFSLRAIAKPCRVNVCGGWDPVDGVSIELLFESETGPRPEYGVVHYLSIGPKPTATTATSTCSWLIPNNTGLATLGFTLLTAHTRSITLSVQVEVDTTSAKTEFDPNGYRTMVHSKFEIPVTVNGDVRVTWNYIGDPPHVREVIWWSKSPRVVPHPSGRPGAPPLVVPFGSHTGLAEYARSPEEEFELRRQHIGTITDGTQSYRRFFFELDQQTQPRGSSNANTGLLSSYLRSRYLLRAENAGFGDTPRFDAFEVNYWRQNVGDIAKKFEQLFAQHCPDQAGGADLGRIAEAFELFAGGQLTDFDTHGAPNGVNFFAFCEFAILCVEVEHNAGFWNEMVAILARSSEIFARCYHLCCGPRTSCSYRVANNPTGLRGFSEVERQNLRNDWQAIDPVVGFARIVNAALEDELYPGGHTPFGLRDKCPEQPGCERPRRRDRADSKRTFD